jgi:hypothetical protein
MNCKRFHYSFFIFHSSFFIIHSSLSLSKSNAMKQSFKKITLKKQTISNLGALGQLLGGRASAQACSPRCALTEWPSCENCTPTQEQ